MTTYFLGNRWLVWAMALSLAAGARPQDLPSAPKARTLRIVPLAGHQEQNDVGQRVMAPLVVQVLDQNARPVDGAEVIFRFPEKGPSAMFANEQRWRSFKTNLDGQAAASGWIANEQYGTFQVAVSAIRGNETGDAILTMTNVARIVPAEGKRERRSGWSRFAKIAAVAGAVAAVTAVVLATRDSGGPPVITASPGSPTIGGPQ